MFATGFGRNIELHHIEMESRWVNLLKLHTSLFRLSR